MSFEVSPELRVLVAAALAEDVGAGDVTTRATVSEGARGRARIVARAPGIVAGEIALRETYRQVDSQIHIGSFVTDGTAVVPDDVVAEIEGAFASLLVAERTALNFLQRLSGVATLTRAFADRVAHTRARIVDTRKTTPGWRAIEKAAVVAGGGHNHRIGLFDAYLIKENHIAAAGGIKEALGRTAHDNVAGMPVEIEVRTLDELDTALEASPRPDRILCDNFEPEALRSAVVRIRAVGAHIVIEASGGVRLDTVTAIAATGVDWISVGALTHSAPALDLSCLIEHA